MRSISRSYVERVTFAPALLGLWAAAIAVAPTVATKIVIAAPVLLAVVVWWTILDPERWIRLFFFCALLLPPLPFPFGNSGVHIAPLFAATGVLLGLLQIDEWRPWRSPLPIVFGIFLAILAGSTGFALFYSGWTVGIGSIARAGLFAIGVYVFIYTFAGPRGKGDPCEFAAFLFVLASLGALFACVDFCFHLPAPAGYAPQFVWLKQGVFRRAQGLFYESSTLGNFCAFFLVMVLAALFRDREERPCSRAILLCGGLVLATALVLSYSRASLVNVLIAATALTIMQGVKRRRLVIAVPALAVATALVVHLGAPAFFSGYWDRIAGSFTHFGSSPDAVLSGRLRAWSEVGTFLKRHPVQLLFGIGYKTLPYSDYAGDGLVIDNTWLSLLAETGIPGMIAFIALNAAILRSSWKAARSTQGRASFFGTWVFCFWIGEMVQMLSGDLITYWRVLPIYFWTLGTAAREAGE